MVSALLLLPSCTSLSIVLILASVEDQLRKIFVLFLVFDSTFIFL